MKKKLSHFTRPVYFVPENFKVRNLLFEFQKKHQKISLVVDEYGILKGLVTLEDILEELFGEFTREEEDIVIPYQEMGKDIYHLSGNLLLEEVRELLGLILEEDLIEGAKTLNGLLLILFKGIPKEGDRISYQGWEFTVKKIKRRKIYLVEAARKENG